MSETFIPISVSPLPMPKHPEFKATDGRCIRRQYDEAYAKFMANREKPDPAMTKAWKDYFAAEKAHYARYARELKKV